MLSKRKCPFENCTSKQNDLLGKCKYCNKIYCTMHRFVEMHKCVNISECYSEKYTSGNKKLLDNKIIEKKIDKI